MWYYTVSLEYVSKQKRPRFLTLKSLHFRGRFFFKLI